jgi:hypothetical protein
MPLAEPRTAQRDRTTSITRRHEAGETAMFAIQQLINETNDLDEVQEPEWQALARCNDGTGSMVELFFSEQLDDIAAAKAFCQ